MMGPPGFYTLACDFFYIKNDDAQFHKYIKKVIHDRSRLRFAIEKGMYEILYGVAGYLYSLLYLQKRYQTANTPGKFVVTLSKYVVEVMQILVENGISQYNKKFMRKLSEDIPQNTKNFRLYYECFEAEYIGGAHGIMGIILVLLYGFEMNQNFLQKNKLDKLKNKILSATTLSLEWLITL